MATASSFEGQLCCAICGYVIAPETAAPDGGTSWQTEAVLLSDPAREFEQLEVHYRGGKRADAPRLDPGAAATAIRKDAARVVEGNRLRLVGSEPPAPALGWWNDAGWEDWGVRANESYSDVVDGEYLSTPYYVATHGACLALAEDAVRRGPLRDLRALWKALRARYEVDDSYYAGTAVGAAPRPQRVPLPHGYYLPEHRDAGAERWEAAHPLAVPDLTAAVLQSLEALPPPAAPGPAAAAFQQRFAALPAELRDHICSFLAARGGLPAACNGLLPQWAWREVLLRGECLPFLRDLDAGAAARFCARWEAEGPRPEPNWELLVRKLGQENWRTWDAEASSLGVPGGLRNRRRVWKLVEEMYVGDLVPVRRAMPPAGGPAVVPRYWDKRGELLYPVVRVNVGSSDT
ncbi:hypothetical protein GGS23DRAFT_604744 [Durotheca rogersii]|uniref:uncharacterized protein n=1 Tax=Durotheca rogersii TaxID=419775 RepID=UPI002220060C|nr:uncharacterized protein GGS23DRAFT_604744 [Durotheca rogersii]KAI5863730.1 hypothetical protein GGS23DRAFT_604744 [Durotheca rogersii]